MTETNLLADLIARARDGHRAAIGELYDLHAEALYNTALRVLGSEPDAEDVVHDVFVGLTKTLRSYQERGKFEAWLKQITARVALMKLRRRKVMAEAPLSEHAPPTAPQSPSSVIDEIALRDALRALSSDLRVVFVLKDIEGYSHAEIAELEDISVAASRTRLFRAREELRQLLEPPHGRR